jgi:hypothetical protein
MRFHFSYRRLGVPFGRHWHGEPNAINRTVPAEFSNHSHDFITMHTRHMHFQQFIWFKTTRDSVRREVEIIL